MQTPEELASLHLSSGVVSTPDAGAVLGMGDTVVYSPCPQRAWSLAMHTDKGKSADRTSLVVQRLRIRLAVQGAWVRSLGRDDPTHFDRQLLSPCSRACAPRREKPVCHNRVAPHSQQLEKALEQQQRPSSQVS